MIRRFAAALSRAAGPQSLRNARRHAIPFAVAGVAAAIAILTHFV